MAENETVDQAPTEGVLMPPINDPGSPVSWPTASLLNLSEDARLLYGSGRQRELDQDWFTPRARSRYISLEERAAYTLSKRDLAAVQEIEAAGLGTLRGKTLYMTTVHERYTVAYGRGSQFIRVYLIDPVDQEKTLLAVLVGADITTHSQRHTGISELSVTARHHDGTDFEEDASRTAFIQILNPSLPNFAGYGHISLIGSLRKAELWPMGTDPALQDKRSGPLDTPELCTSCAKPHPYVPYGPFENLDELTGSLIRITALPLRGYTVQEDGPGSPTTPEKWRS